MKYNDVILDTSVVVDAFDEASVNNESSRQLLKYLLDNKVVIHMPTHSMIELSCALKNMKINKRNMTNAFTQKYPFRCKYIDVDIKFIHNYFVPNLPYIKAGDYIFLCIANKLRIPLITNDKKLIAVCTNSPFPVFSSELALIELAK